MDRKEFIKLLSISAVGITAGASLLPTREEKPKTWIDKQEWDFLEDFKTQKERDFIILTEREGMLLFDKTIKEYLMDYVLVNM